MQRKSLEKEQRRLYVIVDESLDPIYGCVQGGHALAQYLLDYGYENWENEYLIYLYGNTEYWKDVLTMRGMKFAEFHEPDLNDKLTALAVVNDGGMFRKLKIVS